MITGLREFLPLCEDMSPEEKEKIRGYIKRYKQEPYLFIENNLNIKLSPFQKLFLRLKEE